MHHSNYKEYTFCYFSVYYCVHAKSEYYEPNMLQGQFINTYFYLSTAFVLGKDAIFNFSQKKTRLWGGCAIQLLIKSLHK